MAALPVLLALALAPSASATCSVISAYVPNAKAWYGAADAPPLVHFDLADDESTSRNFANDTTAFFFATIPDGPFGWDATPPWSSYAAGANSLRVALFCRTGTQAAYVAVDYDPTAPTVAWSTPADNQWVRGSVPLQVAGQDALSGVDHYVYALPSGAVSTTSGATTLDTTGLPDGPRALAATAVDRAGNRSDAATRAVRIDNTAPTATLDTPATGALLATLSLSATASDGGSGVGQVRFELRAARGGAWQTLGTDAEAPYRLASAGPVADGDYDVRAVADDVLGNETATTPASVTIDATAPSASLDAVPATIAGNVTLAATASDAGSGVAQVEFQEAPADTSAWSTLSTATSAAWTARWSTAGVADGSYALRVLVRDRAGNLLASAIRTTTVHNGVDATPAARAVVTPSAPAVAGKATVALSAVALPRRVESGRTLTVHGTARGIANGLVVITLQSTGSPKLVQRVRGVTKANGSFAISFRPRFSGRVRATFAGNGTHRAAVADGGVIRVHPRLLASVTATRAADGSLSDPHVHGRIAPNGAPVRLVWQARPAHGGSWLLFCRSSDQIVVGTNGVIDGICHVSGLHADNRYRLVLAGGSGASYLPAVTPPLVARPTR